MKTRRFIIALFALAFAFAPQSFRTASAKGERYRYSATRVSPGPGQVLVPGQVVRVEWKSVLPEMDLSWCETEIRLSLDGGATFTWITGERDPREKHFDWIVPNTPTNAAVIDIHFGCLGYFPETDSIQLHSAFVISVPKN
jgi:hypothetical protein